MGAISRFVQINRQLSKALERIGGDFFGYPSYSRELMGRIETELYDRGVESVLEVGGIDRPLLKRSADYTYTGMDLERREACDEIYDHFIIQSIEEPIARHYEMIISMTLLEHVRDNQAAFDSIYRALPPAGTTHHYVPSRNHPYALCLRAITPRIQKALIRLLRPDSVSETGYPAFFHHCSPRAMRALLERTGFTEIEVTAFYRANDYFAFFAPLFLLVSAFENLCRRFGWTLFASGFVISGRRPGEQWDVETDPN